jgi:PAS domain S-box-containing protein
MGGCAPASLQTIAIGDKPTSSLSPGRVEFQHLSAWPRAKRARLFFENAHLALIVSDAATGRIVDVNAAACRQYGYSRADFLNAPSERVVPLLTTSPGVAQHTTASGRPIASRPDLRLRPGGHRLNALLDVAEQTAPPWRCATRASHHRPGVQ